MCRELSKLNGPHMAINKDLESLLNSYSETPVEVPAPQKVVQGYSSVSLLEYVVLETW